MTFRQPSSFLRLLASFSSALKILVFGGSRCRLGDAPLPSPAAFIDSVTKAASSGARASGRLYVHRNRVSLEPTAAAAVGSTCPPSTPAGGAACSVRIEQIHLATDGFTSTRRRFPIAPISSMTPSSSPSACPAVIDLLSFERDRLLPLAPASPPAADRDPFGVGLVEDEDDARPTCLLSKRLIVSVFWGRRARARSRHVS